MRNTRTSDASSNRGTPDPSDRDQVTQMKSLTTRLMREADVVQVCAAAHLAAAGVAYDDSHELVKAARAWFAFFEKAAGVAVEHGEGISLVQFLHAATVMLSKVDSELPDAVVALPVLQFKLAAGTTAQLSKPQFVAWRLETGRLTPAQLSQVTRIDGIGGHEPSLDEVFSAADNGRKKALSIEDWERLVVRFWCCSEPWDELNAYSL